MIELYLSSDGKHTVHAAAETPEKLGPLLPHARAIYEQVLEQFGTKAEMWREATHAKGHGGAKLAAPSGEAEEDDDAQAPRCPIHGRRMVRRHGRFGDFWSCPTRQFNGSWCQVTREISDAAQTLEEGERASA